MMSRSRHDCTSGKTISDRRCGENYCGVLWKVKALTLNILKGATWGTVGIRTRSAPFVCQTVS